MKAGLLWLLLLASPCAAQTLPRDHNGHVSYQGCVKLPGLSQAQVLARASAYARQHFIGPASRSAAWLVDSAAYVVSGAGEQRPTAGSFVPLHYELLVRAQAGGYEYEVSDLCLVRVETYSPAGKSVGIHWRHRYEPVERMLDNPLNYDQQRQPRPHLKAYCATVASEVAAVLAQLRAEIARP